jgi:hypothetical protein
MLSADVVPSNPPQPQDVAPPVHQGVSRVEVARERLSHLISMLEERLQPVLGPVADAPAPRLIPDGPARSDLAAVLFTNGELLEGAGTRLSLLLDRLEV